MIQRGNNREPCFFAVEDYQRYLHDLQQAAKKNNVAVHAYVLMTNHVHLLEKKWGQSTVSTNIRNNCALPPLLFIPFLFLIENVIIYIVGMIAIERVSTISGICTAKAWE